MTVTLYGSATFNSAANAYILTTGTGDSGSLKTSQNTSIQYVASYKFYTPSTSNTTYNYCMHTGDDNSNIKYIINGSNLTVTLNNNATPVFSMCNLNSYLTYNASNTFAANVIDSNVLVRVNDTNIVRISSPSLPKDFESNSYFLLASSNASFIHKVSDIVYQSTPQFENQVTFKQSIKVPSIVGVTLSCSNVSACNIFGSNIMATNYINLPILDSITSTSITQLATPNAVKMAYDLGVWASNGAVWASNGVVSVSNAVSSLSNSHISLSNAFYTSSTGASSTWASNTALWSSNTATDTSNAFYTSTSGSASVFASNAAVYGSNTAIWSSNNLFPKSGGVMLGPLDVNGNATVRGGTYIEADVFKDIPSYDPSWGDFSQLTISTKTNVVGQSWTSQLKLGVTNCNAGMTYIQSINPWIGIPSLVLQPYTGSVGIGVSNPNYKLDVNGTVNASAFVGSTITNLQNLGVFGSNTSVFGSNTSVALSNYVYTSTPPAAVFGSNTAAFGSNTAVFGSNTAVFGSNTAVFGSNTAVFGSNTAVFGSNTAIWSSNNLYNRSTGGNINANVGIKVTPSYDLDIAGYGLQLKGGAGNTPSTFYFNSTGAANTHSVMQFVNNGHQITCTDSNWLGLGKAATGHNIFYVSGAHTFSGAVNVLNTITGPPITALSNMAMYGSNTAVYGSNTAVYGSNTAVWASNILLPKTGGTITGALTIQGNTHTQGTLYVGMDSSSQPDGTYTTGKIMFGNPVGDQGFQNAQIACRRYSTLPASEASELVIAKFNDPEGEVGPDRIRLRAAALVFDTYPDYQNPSGNDSDFHAANIRMYIGSSGNVGINTTSPEAKLHVVGDASITDNLTLKRGTDAASGTFTYFPFTDGKNYIRGTTILADTSTNENVGIGTTTPQHKLDVNGMTRTTKLKVGNDSASAEIGTIQIFEQTVGSSSVRNFQFTINGTFPNEYSVWATPLNEIGTYTDNFSVTVMSRTTSSIVFSIYRTDANSGWGQQLKLQVLLIGG